MPYYPDELISEVCEANDMVDLVSEYTTLKRAGTRYMGLCPFHHEKSPSFSVNREKQLFHCFGCGVGGNMVQFVQKAENLDFQDALKYLADRAHIVLPENERIKDDGSHKLREKIYEMNKLAARFYYKNLVATPEGKEALAYLINRRITPETVKTYGLGYAPESFDAVRTFLSEQGYTDRDMITAGFIKENNGRVYDRFRGRVMFPIINVRGKLIGFGGRIIKSETGKDGYKPAKYLNSAETPVFDKGSNLFSLNLAKNSGEKSIILCEGYMDVISVYQAGVHNIAATLGTAVTSNQARLLKKYASEVILCYDSDDAGQKATMRAIDIMSGAGMKTRVMRLKGAKDPDEYIKAYGVAGFKDAVAASLPATEYKLSLAKRRYDLDTPDGKVGFISEAADVLAGVDDAIEVDAYLKSVSRETDISERAIAGELGKRTAAKSKARNAYTQTPAKRPIRTGGTSSVIISEKKDKLYNTEKQLVRLIAEDKNMYLTVKEEISPSDFTVPLFARLAERIYALREDAKTPEVTALMSAVCGTDEESAEAASVFFDDKPIDSKAAIAHELISTVKIEALRRKIKDNPTDITLQSELIKLMQQTRQPLGAKVKGENYE